MKFGILMLLLLTARAPAAGSDHADPNSKSFHLLGQVKVGGKGGWDALAIDQQSHLLFMSHVDQVVVVDLVAEKIIKQIPTAPGTHCIAIAEDIKKAFVTNGKDDSVSVIDLKTLSVSKKIKTGTNPDAIVYASKSGKVFAFNSNDHTVSVIDAKTDKVKSRIKLGGKPEFAVYDPKTGNVFVNMEDIHQLREIDSVTEKEAKIFKLSGCESPSGIALDVKNRILFSACENEKVAIINADTGMAISLLPTGLGSDGAEFDSSLELAFVPNGKSGTMTIIKETSADRFDVVETVKTQIGARTIALDQATHKVYLPTSDFHPAVSGERPKSIDGSQTILIFGM